ncbi:MAG: hypothetical protein A4E57_01866 [Syntrophorhabdaceae bacterium PtaU1.Bin034]|nr:MAG: hypothetical protein A4E57_01866 [Syntrophorhabdaceae bacterium PtaU1.Bin034]
MAKPEYERGIVQVVQGHMLAWMKDVKGEIAGLKAVTPFPHQMRYPFRPRNRHQFPKIPLLGKVARCHHVGNSEVFEHMNQASYVVRVRMSVDKVINVAHFSVKQERRDHVFAHVEIRSRIAPSVDKNPLASRRFY